MYDRFSFDWPTNRHATSTLHFALVLAFLTIVNGMSHLCLFPSYLRPGSDYTVSVTVINPSSSVSIEVTIAGSSEVYTSRASASAKASTVLITVSVPVMLNESTYVLKLRGSGGLTFYDTANLKVFRKTASVFIQTDKVLYRPGQTVLFAVVVVNANMKPYTDVFDIDMYDKEHRKMGRWANNKSPKGYFSSEMQLSTYIPLGTWSIEVSIPSAGMPPTKKTFEIMEYELPKFEVTIDSSFNYMLLVSNPPAQQPLSIPITAKFTYGQPVKGSVEISASVIVDNRKTLEITDPRWTTTMDLVEGRATATISPDQLSSIVPGILKMTATAYPWTLLDGRNIYIVAKVTETATQDEISSSMIVNCRVLKYDLRFSNITSGSFQDGQEYTGYLELKQKDGSDPIESDIRLPNKTFRQINMTFHARDDCPRKIVEKSFPLTASGFVSFSFQTQDFNCPVLFIRASFLDESSNNKYYFVTTIEKFKSIGKQYISVDLGEMPAAYEAGDVLNFNFKTAKRIDAYYYVLMSKGSIVSAQTVNNPSNPDLLNIRLDRALAPKLSPKARMVVWCVTDNSEIISDSIEFYVNAAFAGNVTVAFGKTTIEPKKSLTLEVRGYPDSVAYVLAVDKSTTLLKDNNFIKQKLALDDLMTYENADMAPMTQGINTKEIFTKSLLMYFTDGLIYSDDITLPPNPTTSASTLSGWFDSVESFTRIYFPETWIWSSVVIGEDHVGYLTVKAPDTITSFVATVFTIHEQEGLGIAKYTSEVTVFLPLFVSTSFPRRVRIGEQFSLRATVYNYLNSSQKITVTLKASLFFGVQQRTGIVNNVDITREISVPRRDAFSVSFWIVTSKAGDVPIVVTATAGSVQDIENRTILVIPEGVQQWYCKSAIIQLTKEVSDSSNSFTIEVPSQTQLVPDSVHVELTVVGELIGVPPELPASTQCDVINCHEISGQDCAEQRMIYISGIVYLAEYLSATNSLTSEFEASYRSRVLEAYQGELLFQRKDKSFSAWGNNDTSGSSWLSAFVVKTFNVAMKSNRLPIGRENLASTLEWIINTQDPAGYFKEPDKARVIHVDIQGLTGRGIPMTAFIVITLIESRSNPFVESGVLELSISKAVAYLEGQLNSINDSYTLCIVAYALVLAKSSRADDALKKRDALAHVSLDQKYWGVSKPVQFTRPQDFNYPRVKAPGSDIEMTAFALLTYAAQKRITEALPIVKWLIYQRNPRGGYRETQDTALGVEALTRYAALATAPRNSEVKVQARGDTDEYTFYPITGSNKFILQKWEPSSTLQTINIQASGVGSAIVQLNVRYNVYTAPVPLNGGIKLDVETQTNGNVVIIRTCASATSNVSTGMALQTIDLVSGYVPTDLYAGESNSNVVKIDVNNNQIAIYYQKLSKDATCTSIKLKKEFAIMLSKNASISCLDYYNPDNFYTVSYAFKETQLPWQTLCPPCNV